MTLKVQVANWQSIQFFIERMTQHDSLRAAPAFLDEGVFSLLRVRLPDVTVFYSGAYSFGLADVELLPQQLGDNSYVIIMEHCNFTQDARSALDTIGIGIGTVRDLMGALNERDVWTYTPRSR